MKTLALVATATLLPFTLFAADNPAPRTGNLRELLQQGLFEEEANGDRGKAAAAYTDIVAQYDTQRAFAATALYRLAEIRAKEGNKAEAIALHQRLLAEFSNHEALAKCSRERLAELGGTLPAAIAQVDAPTEAEARELVQLREIVKNSPDLLNAPEGPENITPLVKAAKNGWIAAATFLLDQGVDPNSFSGAPLMTAAAQGHKRMVELLLGRGANVNQQDYSHRTALFSSVVNGRLEVARVLLAQGADPNVVVGGQVSMPTGQYKGAPLHVAAAYGSDQMIELLLEHKADPNLVDENGNPPLVRAVHSKNEGAVKNLLARGANVNLPLGGGDSVLHSAARNWPKIVPLLLEFGASVKAKTEGYGIEGQTPMHSAIAAFSRLDSPAPQLNDSELEQLYKLWEALLAKGADINARDALGATPLHYAARRKVLPTDALGWLIEHGADLHAEDKAGKTVFHYASDFDRQLELERRFLFPKWAEERAVNVHILATAVPVDAFTITPGIETDTPPPLRDAIVSAIENVKEVDASKDRWPSNFKVRVYRRQENGQIEEIAQASQEALSPKVGEKPVDPPALVWGDIVILQQFRSGTQSKESFLESLRSVSFGSPISEAAPAEPRRSIILPATPQVPRSPNPGVVPMDSRRRPLRR